MDAEEIEMSVPNIQMNDSLQLHRSRSRGVNEKPPTDDDDGNRFTEERDIGSTASSSLPPIDGGKQAWLCLAGCSLIQAPVWGFGLAFGVLQQFYGSHADELDGKVKNVAIIGTTATGVLYLCSPFTFAILSRWPRIRRQCGPVGLVIAAGSLLISSFLTSVSGLILTQGVLHAIGTGLLFAATTLYLDEWWMKRKGIAYGVMWAGKSFFGTTLPFIMDALLNSLGWKWTIRIWAAAIAITTAPMLLIIKPRIPVSQSTKVRRLDMSFLRGSSFWMLEAGNVFQSLGYFLPQAYLPTYAVSQGCSPLAATAILAVFNATSIIGNIGLGMMNDRTAVTAVILLSSVGSAVTVFLLWGFSSGPVLIAIFSVLYGCSAGGYSSTWSGIQQRLKRECPGIETGFIFGLLAGGRGIGNAVSGPLSVALLTKDNWLHSGKDWGFNTEYGPLILFTGATAVLGAWGCLNHRPLK